VIDVSGIWRVTRGVGSDFWRESHFEVEIVGDELVMKSCADRTNRDGSGNLIKAEGERWEARATLNGRDFSFILPSDHYPMAGRIAREIRPSRTGKRIRTAADSCGSTSAITTATWLVLRVGDPEDSEFEEEVTMHERRPHTFTFQDDSTSSAGPFVRVLQSGVPFGKIVGPAGSYRFYEGESEKLGEPDMQHAALDVLEVLIIAVYRVCESE
jgi:hypothetical protein